MGFTNLNPTGNVFLVENATNCRFQNVGFRGASTQADLTVDTNNSIGVSFASTDSLICDQITFEGCVFSGLVWGVNTNQETKSITISQSNFNTLYRGIVLGQNTTVRGGPTGTRIVSNVFDLVYAEGIIFGSNLGLGINASGHNIFYDVGNHFSGINGTPASSIISILSNNNVSISDLFARSDDLSKVFARVDINNTTSIATTNGKQLAMGTWTRQSGQQETLINDTNEPIFTISSAVIKTFKIEYSIVRTNAYRIGTIIVATNSGSPDLAFNDDYVENISTGITLSVSQTGSDVSFNYSATDTGQNGTIYYSVTYLA